MKGSEDLSTPYREPGELPAYSVLSQGPASRRT